MWEWGFIVVWEWGFITRESSRVKEKKKCRCNGRRLLFCLQCVAACCSMLQVAVVRYSMLQWFMCGSVLQCVAVCCSVLQCVAVVAVCCSVLQYTRTYLQP